MNGRDTVRGRCRRRRMDGRRMDSRGQRHSRGIRQCRGRQRRQRSREIRYRRRRAQCHSPRGSGKPQQAYQQTPPRPVAAQAGYQQASGKQDLEKTIGRAILPVCAAGLIFLSLVFFAMLVLPYLSQGVKMVLMYTVSAAITLAGGILVAHDRRNKAFLGCWAAAWERGISRCF